MKFTIEQIAEAVRHSTSWRQVAMRIGASPDSGGQTHTAKRAKQAGIDFSHFNGKLWSKGKRTLYCKSTAELLTIDTVTSSHELKLRLIRDGYKEGRCENCGLSEWLGEPLVLELDHINRVRTDNRLENLQILCPNCHALKTRKDQAKKRTNA